MIKESADNSEHWAKDLHEAALIYMTRTATNSIPPGHIHSDTRGVKRDRLETEYKAIFRNGVYITDESGREICMSFNKGKCYGCRRSHRCEKCLGEHAANDKACGGNQGKGNQIGKGKGKRNKKGKGKGNAAHADAPAQK